MRLDNGTVVVVMGDPFVHLRVASGYSLQYGASHPAALVAAAADHDMDTVLPLAVATVAARASSVRRVWFMNVSIGSGSLRAAGFPLIWDWSIGAATDTVQSIVSLKSLTGLL